MTQSQQHITEPPLGLNIDVPVMGTSLSPPRALAIVRAALGAVERQRTKPRKPRKPTPAYLATLANKPGVARVEMKPDGTVVVVTGTPEPAAPENPWPLDEFRTKETKQ